MRVCTATIKGISPYSPSLKHDTPKLPKEADDAYEERTWRNKCHVNDEGYVIIPPMNFKFALDDAAKWEGERIKGKGAKQWTARFVAGILIMEPLTLPVKASELGTGKYASWVFSYPMNVKGIRGPGARVMRTFPMIREWRGDVLINVLDDMIEEKTLEKYLNVAGKFIGIGRFAPRRGGYNGRFLVEKVAWSKEN